MTEKPKQVAVIGHGLGGGLSVLRIALAAARGGGYDLLAGQPGPPSLHDQGPRGRSGQTLLPLQLRRGAVEHTYTPKPLTKRQKRRLRGKEKF